jgi:hypothetical protein
MKKHSIIMLLATIFLILGNTLAANAAARSFDRPFADVGLQILFTSPDHGLPQGGETVRIVGVNFQSGAKVVWNGKSISATFIDSNILTVNTPPGQPGMIDVEVINPDGAQTTLNNCFTYDGQPAVVKLTAPIANSVLSADGAPVMIAWKVQENTIYSFARQRLMLSTDGGATFPIQLAANLDYTARSFEWVAPADLITDHARLTLEVIQLGLVGSDVMQSDFKIVVAPQISGISPTTARASDGAFDLTITGSGFDNGAQVMIDNNIVTASKVASDQIVINNFSPGKAGSHFISVRNGDGTISRSVLFAVAQ